MASQNCFLVDVVCVVVASADMIGRNKDLSA